MTHPPVVTVIIPTYNHAHFLKDALQSLCKQTYTDWEAIVINNYSEDDTVAVVESFSDPRIMLENFHNDGVIAASRNKGITLAKGDFLAFLDSDDSWYPEKLARCMEYFDNGIGLVCHGLHWIGDQERDIFSGPEKRATFDALLYKGYSLTPTAVVVVKDLVESVGCFSEKPAIVTAEDYHLWIKLAQMGIQMCFIREILGQYRVHSGNQSGSVLCHLAAVLSVVKEFFPSKNSRSLSTRMRIRRRYCIAYYGAGRAMQRNNKYTQSWLLLFSAIIYWPFYMKSYAAIMLGLIAVVRQWRK